MHPHPFPATPLLRRNARRPTFETPPLRLDALEVFDSAHQVHTQATLENYYRIVSNLIRGDATRPPLPLELVIQIVRLAGLDLPYPSRDLSSLLTWIPSSPRRMCGTGLMRSPVKMVPLLKTAPLPKDALRTISSIEIVVNFLQATRYKTEDYWNIFYISISERSETSQDETTDKTKQTLSWPCFERVRSGVGHSENQTSAPFEPLRRSVVDYDHEIWQYLVAGDCIEISAKTKTLIAPNPDCEAVIRVYKTWEPSAEMLKLLYTF